MGFRALRFPFRAALEIMITFHRGYFVRGVVSKRECRGFADIQGVLNTTDIWEHSAIPKLYTFVYVDMWGKKTLSIVPPPPPQFSDSAESFGYVLPIIFSF